MVYAAAVKVKLLKAEREFEALPEVVANTEAAAELITNEPAFTQGDLT